MSLGLRLAAGIALVLALGGVAVAVAAFAYGRSAAQQSFDRLLIGAANQIARSLSLEEGQLSVDIPPTAFELLSLAPRDRIVYGVIGPDGTVITGYEGLKMPATGVDLYNGDFSGEPARFVRVTRYFAERGFSGAVDVIVGQTTQARRALAGQITRNALIAVSVVGVILSVLAVLTVRQALAPLRGIERDILDRSSDDLTPIDEAAPREISGLLAALNRFMARIDRQMQARKNLIADTSHQLRTPIAALRAHSELARDEPDPARLREMIVRIDARARDLGRLTDQLLNHALIIHRADAIALQPLDLRMVAMQAVEQTDRMHVDDAAGLRLDLSEAPVMCRGDRLSLVEACKNLISNALRHGAAPVVVSVDAPQGRARLVVRDSGPGVAQAQWAELASRFADEHGVSDTSAGLGLAIVHAVLEAHGATLSVARPGPKSFTVTMELPPLAKEIP